MFIKRILYNTVVDHSNRDYILLFCKSILYVYIIPFSCTTRVYIIIIIYVYRNFLLFILLYIQLFDVPLGPFCVVACSIRHYSVAAYCVCLLYAV